MFSLNILHLNLITSRFKGEEQPDMVQNLNSVPRDEEYLPYPAVAPVVFFGLKQTTRPRNWCLKVACSLWLDYGSRLMALLSCANMCMYETCKEPSNLLTILERVTFSFFMVEMLMKMVALGVFGHQESYLSNNWNKFEVLTNSVHVVDYFLAFFGINWQIYKLLEPMRLIGRLPVEDHYPFTSGRGNGTRRGAACSWRHPGEVDEEEESRSEATCSL